MLKTICIIPAGNNGAYGHMAVMEEGRAVFQAHCGNPVLDWRLISIVARALRHLGDDVQPAEDFAVALRGLGYVVDGEELAPISSAPVDIPQGNTR